MLGGEYGGKGIISRIKNQAESHIILTGKLTMPNLLAYEWKAYKC